MSAIQTYMTARHRHCDDSFAAAEEQVSNGNWEQGGQRWRQFAQELEHHLQQEEQLLFPAFEAQTGSTAGPTAVMKMEHTQMRAMLADIERALVQRNGDGFLGLTETLMILMQQHNMKEEQILYPMSDQMLPDNQALAARLSEF
jgi:iron-sulfur cluster repair protein YtfE (RIC family)